MPRRLGNWARVNPTRDVRWCVDSAPVAMSVVVGASLDEATCEQCGAVVRFDAIPAYCPCGGIRVDNTADLLALTRRILDGGGVILTGARA
jgi:hypothetical protein